MRQTIVPSETQTPSKPRAVGSAARARAAERDPRWARLVARDAGADGAFVYSVRTTGVFCRPSCGARLPRPENVAFHPTAAEAQRRGFRACKRCRPDRPLANRDAERVVRMCRFIEQHAGTPSLDELASHAGLSSFHVQRLFRSVTGVTPRAYATALRGSRVREGLRSKGSVTAAIHHAGYGSSSRFYEKSDALLGMTPTQYRSGAPGQRVRVAVGRCSVGAILVAATERGVCAISLGDEPGRLVDDLARRFPRAEIARGDAEFEQLVADVIGLVERPAASRGLPLDVRGTVFQQRVWQALTEIPAGETLSYAQLATKLGDPRSTRAVASACAANKLAVAIPCHRVVRSDGGLASYRWGVERKRALLEREASVVAAPLTRRPARAARLDPRP